ncbi:hypothetical protein QBC40DRAFT_52639 [Triangularia verruculosa]|uniref:Uncharacterized protein n=1 Tax=Triangularia verruculosa TaxID=2587418 RepID=A0AAN7AWN0_9PEZI|nr:hypothetical protein QBC40DRAFT_52639 [Triangularia verruculosa]
MIAPDNTSAGLGGDNYAQQWILMLALTALVLSLAILSQFATRYARAYIDAPSEVPAFLDAIDSSIVENESYDLDIEKVKRLEDKLRLGKLLRDIQKAGDALREALSALMEETEGEKRSTRLRTGARLLWATHRQELDEKVRRMDLLRMRFLVVHMGIIAGMANETAALASRTNGMVIHGSNKREPSQRPAPLVSPPMTPEPPPLPPPLRSFTDSPVKSRLPLRRLTVHSMGHPEAIEAPHRTGWAGVMQELQRSPVLRERHASIELAMSRAAC